MNADVLLIGADWRLRALLRAQLIEEGFDVVALGSWDEAELLLRKRAVSARATVFDLEGEPNPQAALSTLARLVPPPTSVVLTSSAALPPRHPAIGIRPRDRPAPQHRRCGEGGRGARDSRARRARLTIECGPASRRSRP